jgi:hypothetical protein
VGRCRRVASSRAATAGTRRRCILPGLSPALLRERAGRLALENGVVAASGEESAIVRSRPPSSSPLRILIRPAPSRIDRSAVIVVVASESRPRAGIREPQAIRRAGVRRQESAAPFERGSLQGLVDLGGIHDLFKADYLAVLDGEDVREAG